MANNNDRSTDMGWDSLQRSLQQIGLDFWGTPDQKQAQKAREARAAVEKDFAALAKDPYLQQESAAEPARPKQAAEQEKELTFEDFWRMSDDAIDWTEAMTHAVPVDGVKDAQRWAFCHEIAGKVLQGDVEAYHAVVEREQPLQDCAAYASDVDVLVDDPDEAAIRFVPKAELADEYGNTYLAALGLRMARDMMALLPLSRVHVEAVAQDKNLMDVTWRRSKLNKVRLSHADPLALAAENGAVFAECGETQEQ